MKGPRALRYGDPNTLTYPGYPASQTTPFGKGCWRNGPFGDIPKGGISGMYGWRSLHSSITSCIRRWGDTTPNTSSPSLTCILRIWGRREGEILHYTPSNALHVLHHPLHLQDPTSPRYHHPEDVCIGGVHLRRGRDGRTSSHYEYTPWRWRRYHPHHLHHPSHAHGGYGEGGKGRYPHIPLHTIPASPRYPPLNPSTPREGGLEEGIPGCRRGVVEIPSPASPPSHP